jgi:hypothetical protein
MRSTYTILHQWTANCSGSGGTPGLLCYDDPIKQAEFEKKLRMVNPQVIVFYYLYLYFISDNL